jgi:hypothetical protein
MHFCKANVQIGGDIRNVMYRNEFDPVSWPEVEILRAVHGNESVLDVEPFVAVEQRPRDERERLLFLYGEGPLRVVWGGRNAPDEMEAAGATLVADTLWFNPLSRKVENSGQDGSHSQPLPSETPPSGSQFETRPAVEIVGQPMAGSPAPVNDPYSEYPQDDPTQKPRKK